MHTSSPIIFRVVFVSLFFELEVRCLNGVWQTVHSQVGKQHGSEAHIIMYPVLKFASLPLAIDYANNELGLHQEDKGGLLDSILRRFSFFSAPPASFLRDSNKPLPVASNNYAMSAEKIELIAN